MCLHNVYPRMFDFWLENKICKMRCMPMMCILYKGRSVLLIDLCFIVKKKNAKFSSQLI